MSHPGAGLDHKQPPALILNVPLHPSAVMSGFDGMSLPSARGGGSLFSPTTLAAIPGLRLPDNVQRLEPLIPSSHLGMSMVAGPSLLPMPKPLDLGGSGQPPLAADAARVQIVAERLEGKLGAGHPQVGKAWLTAARMYMHIGAAGGPDMAARASHALQRARDACNHMARAAAASMQPSVSLEFDFLVSACSTA